MFTEVQYLQMYSCDIRRECRPTFLHSDHSSLGSAMWPVKKILALWGHEVDPVTLLDLRKNFKWQFTRFLTKRRYTKLRILSCLNWLSSWGIGRRAMAEIFLKRPCNIFRGPLLAHVNTVFQKHSLTLFTSDLVGMLSRNRQYMPTHLWYPPRISQ